MIRQRDGPPLIVLVAIEAPQRRPCSVRARAFLDARDTRDAVLLVHVRRYRDAQRGSADQKLIRSRLQHHHRSVVLQQISRWPRARQRGREQISTQRNRLRCAIITCVKYDPPRSTLALRLWQQTFEFL